MDDLIQRLNGITARLIAEKSSGRDGKTVLACHGKLDGLETLFFGSLQHADRDSPRDRTAHSSNNAAGNNGGAGLQLPSRLADPGQELISHNGAISVQEQQEQQELLRRMSKAAHELRNRHEELKHVHDLAIIQAECAAQRILSLEGEVQELESNLNALQSSYTFLKLQLKALEAQALRYIPADDKEGLLAGFQRWKKDWRDLDRQVKARQKRP